MRPRSRARALARALLTLSLVAHSLTLCHARRPSFQNWFTGVVTVLKRRPQRAHGTSAAPGGDSVELSLTILRLPFTGRGEAAVTSALAHGALLSRGGGSTIRFTQIYQSITPETAMAQGRYSRQGGLSSWVPIGARPARPLSSVTLPAGQAEAVLADARAFLDSEVWYADRGIPYRRGYLFHGPPGSGKTSLIRAIAGELSLPIYILRLTGLNDEKMMTLLDATAPRSCVVLEDCDLAWAKSGGDAPSRAQAGAGSQTEVTQAGLLNALDGVGSQENRLLFLTTNNLSTLPFALSA